MLFLSENRKKNCDFFIVLVTNIKEEQVGAVRYVFTSHKYFSNVCELEELFGLEGFFLSGSKRVNQHINSRDRKIISTSVLLGACQMQLRVDGGIGMNQAQVCG